MLPGMNLTREQQQQILQNLQLRSLPNNPSLPQRDALPQLPPNQQLLNQLSSQQISRSLANLPSFPQTNPVAALSLITQQQQQMQYQPQNSTQNNSNINMNRSSAFQPSQFIASNGQPSVNFIASANSNFQSNQQQQISNLSQGTINPSNLLGIPQNAQLNPQMNPLANLSHQSANQMGMMNLPQQMNQQQQQMLLQQARQQLLSQPNQVAALKQRILQSNMVNSPLMNQQQNQQLQQHLLNRNLQDLSGSSSLPGSHSLNSSSQPSQFQTLQQNQSTIPSTQFIGKNVSSFPPKAAMTGFDPSKFQAPSQYKQSPLPQAVSNFNALHGQTMTPSVSSESANLLRRSSGNDQAPDALRRKSSVEQFNTNPSTVNGASQPSSLPLPAKDERPTVPTTSFHGLLPNDAAFFEKLEAMSTDEVSSAASKLNQLIGDSRDAVYRHHFKAHVDRCHAIMRDYQNLLQSITQKNNFAASVPKRNVIEVTSKRRRFQVYVFLLSVIEF